MKVRGDKRRWEEGAKLLAGEEKEQQMVLRFWIMKVKDNKEKGKR